MNTNDVYVDHCPVCVRQHTFCCNLHSHGGKKEGWWQGHSRGLGFVLSDQCVMGLHTNGNYALSP